MSKVGAADSPPTPIISAATGGPARSCADADVLAASSAHGGPMITRLVLIILLIASTAFVRAASVPRMRISRWTHGGVVNGSAFAILIFVAPVSD